LAESMPLNGISTAGLCRGYVPCWIWTSWLGVPSTVMSNRGVQFTSAVWQAVVAKLDVQKVGNITSKHNDITRYRFSHVIRAVTIKSNNVSYEHRAITVRIYNEA
jgi:hypothetical protein